ncbi:MAG TPA: cupin domain-containing protein [Methylomirabilota bacterium]|jgi:quercetin dioxygenase-like cupin family protein|nr:cupin domain-containing protein [Methylomirabilota bacterium]
MRRIVPAVLMFTALAALSLVTIPLPAEEHAHTVALPATLKWAEPAVLPGALLAVVQGDPSKEGLFVYRLKMPPGYRIPPHLHKASENVTVLSGDFFIGLGEKLDQGKGQELPVGAFLSVPPNHPHYAWVGGSETIVQVHGVGPTDLRFVNPEDDPRKKK